MPRHPYLSKQAVQSGQNIVLRANFDPGWERLQRENGFEVLPRSDLAKELLQQPYALVECYSANEILQHARNIKQRAEDLSVFDNVYVSALHRPIPFDEYFVGMKSQVLSGIFNKFCTQIHDVQSLLNREFAENFLERPEDGVEERQLRALHPAMFIFKPSQNTQNQVRGENALMISSPTKYGQGDLEYILALDVKDPKIREVLRSPYEKFLTITPYIRWEKAQQSFDESTDPNETKKYLLIQGKVDHMSQISNLKPRQTLESFSR